MSTGDDTPRKVELPFEDARALFDMVCNSMDFGSGFLETNDVTVMRRLAVIIGVDPTLGTPRAFATQYPHAYQSTKMNCGHCRRIEDDPIHKEHDE